MNSDWLRLVPSFRPPGFSIVTAANERFFVLLRCMSRFPLSSWASKCQTFRWTIRQQFLKSCPPCRRNRLRSMTSRKRWAHSISQNLNGDFLRSIIVILLHSQSRWYLIILTYRIVKLYFPAGCLFAAMAGSVDPINAVLLAEVLKIFTIGDKDEQSYLAMLYGLCFAALGSGALLSQTLEVSRTYFL